MQVGLSLAGLVDAATEIKKAEKNLKPLKKIMSTLEAKMADEKYKKTPENVRHKDVIKKETTAEKIKALETVIADFKALL